MIEKQIPDDERRRLQAQPTGELFKELFDQAQQMVQQELRVARAEAEKELRKAVRGSAITLAGGAIVYAGFLALIAGLVALSSTFLPLWAAALIVGVLVCVAGGLAVAEGRRELKQLHPTEPVRQLKEDGQWAKHTMQSIRSNRHARA